MLQVTWQISTNSSAFFHLFIKSITVANENSMIIIYDATVIH